MKMGRLRLELPTHFAFSTDMPVRIGDINYGGHLGNDSVLSLTNEARLRFLNENGFSESDIEGFGLIMIDAVIVYQSQASYGNILKIEVTAGNFSRCGLDFIYRLSDKSTGKEVARAKTGVAFFDYAKKNYCKGSREIQVSFCPSLTFCGKGGERS